ncbi:MAG: hypothetical protein AAGJ85_05915 [Pseudomonadota bacterium]
MSAVLELRAIVREYQSAAGALRVLDGAGHGLNYQQHAVVNPWLVEWFGE